MDDLKEQQLQLSKKKDASKILNTELGVGTSSFNEYLNSKEFPSSKRIFTFKKKIKNLVNILLIVKKIIIIQR